MMANPFEFRETMWALLDEGEAPAPRGDRPGSTGAKPEGKALTRGDSRKLNDMRDQLLALAEAKGKTERRPPMPRPAPEQT